MSPAYLRQPAARSEPDPHVSGCTGKVRFETYGDASIVRDKRASPYRRKGPAATEAYRCEACGGWHLGRRHGRPK